MIEREARIDPQKVHLATANITGSLRLLVGLAWLRNYFTAAFFKKTKAERFVNVKPGKAHDGGGGTPAIHLVLRNYSFEENFNPI